MKKVYKSLIDIVSSEEDVSISNILHSRERASIRARGVISYIMYTTYKQTFKTIGKYLNRSEAQISRIYKFYSFMVDKLPSERAYIRRVSKKLELALNPA